MSDLARLAYEASYAGTDPSCFTPWDELPADGKAMWARVVQAVAGWRPIETAPKDGTRVLLWDCRKGVVVSGCWHSDPGQDDPNGYEPAWAWWTADEDIVMWDSGPEDAPTHWLPLPAPPPDPAPEAQQRPIDGRDGCRVSLTNWLMPELGLPIWSGWLVRLTAPSSDAHG